MNLADLTLGELHDAAVAAGWEFSFQQTTGMFQSASPLLGYDRGAILVGRELGRR